MATYAILNFPVDDVDEAVDERPRGLLTGVRVIGADGHRGEADARCPRRRSSAPGTSRAAQQLRIARMTLYQRLRRCGISRTTQTR